MVHVTNNDQTSTGIKPKNMLNPSMAKKKGSSLGDQQVPIMVNLQ